MRFPDKPNRPARNANTAQAVHGIPDPPTCDRHGDKRFIHMCGHFNTPNASVRPAPSPVVHAGGSVCVRFSCAVLLVCVCGVDVLCLGGGLGRGLQGHAEFGGEAA